MIEEETIFAVEVYWRRHLVGDKMKSWCDGVSVAAEDLLDATVRVLFLYFFVF